MIRAMLVLLTTIMVHFKSRIPIRSMLVQCSGDANYNDNDDDMYTDIYDPAHLYDERG